MQIRNYLVITLPLILIASSVAYRFPELGSERDGQPRAGVLTGGTGAAEHDEHLLQRQIELLDKGSRWLRATNGYTGTLERQERVGDELEDTDTINIALRHEPFSVRLDWGENGRRVVFIDGQNDGKMLVREAGLASLLGTVRIDPHGRLAMRRSKYTIDETGILALAERLLGERREDLKHPNQVRCRMGTPAQIGDRIARPFIVEYLDRHQTPGYGKSTTWLEEDTGLPLAVEYFDIPNAVDSANRDSLLARFVFSDLEFRADLLDSDFEL